IGRVDRSSGTQWYCRAGSFKGNGGLAINSCMQVPDRAARRGGATDRVVSGGGAVLLVGSLQSKLRSRGGSPAPCVTTQVGAT
ncbi:MAG: hypothetical protein ACREMY_08305, partial [bacterium]